MRISLALAVVSVQLGICCECVLPSAKAEAKHSEVVFSGTITDVSDSQITFAVQRVFKGRLPAVFKMANLVMGGLVLPWVRPPSREEGQRAFGVRMEGGVLS